MDVLLPLVIIRQRHMQLLFPALVQSMLYDRIQDVARPISAFFLSHLLADKFLDGEDAAFLVLESSGDCLHCEVDEAH